MMKHNPELIRNLWLEITLHRLVAMPFIIFILFQWAYVTGDTGLDSYMNIISLAHGMFFLMVIIWGAKKVADSITDEVSQKTWDFQKLSAITPWKMTTGKFIGSSIYTWYGGLIILAVFGTVLTLIHNEITYLESVGSFTGERTTDKGHTYTTYNYGYRSKDYMNLNSNVILIKMALLFCGGILVQAVSMFISAASLSQGRDSSRKNSIVSIGAALAIGCYLFVFESMYYGGAYFNISWFGAEFDKILFVLTSVILFAAWFIIGTYRQIKKELQYSILPWVWCFFLAFFVSYIVGFTAEKYSVAMNLFYPLMILIFFTYVTIFTEAKTPIIYRKLLDCFLRKNWKKLFATTPLWLLTYAIVAMVTAALSLISLFPSIHELEIASFLALVLVAFLMLTRDILIVTFFNLSTNRKRADLTAVVYLFILYIVLPSIFIAMGSYNIAHYFLPIPSGAVEFIKEGLEQYITDKNLLAVAYAFSQVVVMGFVVFLRLKRQKILA